MNSFPKTILLLNPLKDLAYWGLTKHAIESFSRLPAESFVAYGFFNNALFACGSLRRMPYQTGLRGVLGGLEHMRKLNPDILYGTGTISEFVYFLFRPRAAKYVVAWHGPYDKKWLLDIGNYSFRAYVSYWVASYLLARADLLACDTEFIATSLRRVFPDKKIVITLEGVDGNFYNPGKRNPKWLTQFLPIVPEQPTFVFIGHLIRRKRPEIFVELARQMPKASFVMIGREGFYTASDVKNWQASLPNLIWVPSSLTREEMPILLASATGLIFPSLAEPFGFAVIEAMASGAVVIATRSGSLPELIEDGEEGFLVDEGNGEIKKFISAAEKIINGGPAIEAICKRARLRVETVFNWDDVAKRYEEAFHDMVL